MDEPLLNPLLNIGLHEKEAKVYLALLELGEAPVTEIAAKADLKRSIVYVVLDDLTKRGYVSELPGRKVRYFVATDPSKFLQNFQAYLDDLRLVLPVLRALQKRVGRPKIEIFEGKTGVLSVYRTFDYGRELRYLSNMQRLKEYFPKELERWIQGILAGTIAKEGQKLLSVDDPVGREYSLTIQKKAGQECRLLSKGLVIEMDFAIVDDKLGITNFDPLFIVLIHSLPVARSAAVLFDLAWKQSRLIRDLSRTPSYGKSRR